MYQISPSYPAGARSSPAFTQTVNPGEEPYRYYTAPDQAEVDSITTTADNTLIGKSPGIWQKAKTGAYNVGSTLKSKAFSPRQAPSAVDQDIRQQAVTQNIERSFVPKTAEQIPSGGGLAVMSGAVQAPDTGIMRMAGANQQYGSDKWERISRLTSFGGSSYSMDPSDKASMLLGKRQSSAMSFEQSPNDKVRSMLSMGGGQNRQPQVVRVPSPQAVGVTTRRPVSYRRGPYQTRKRVALLQKRQVYNQRRERALAALRIAQQKRQGAAHAKYMVR